MPEFALNLPARRQPPHAYDSLSTFAKAYVEAMFFTNGDTGDDAKRMGEAYCETYRGWIYHS